MFLTTGRSLIAVLSVAQATIGAVMISAALLVLLRPWSRAMYRRLVAQYVSCMWVDAMTLIFPSAQIHITVDSDMPDSISTGIVVANHQYEMDWWYMLMVTRLLGLHGNVKVVVKEELKQTPLLGWLLRLVEYPFIHSSWSRSRVELFGLLRSFTADSFPVLLFLFPEGDRIDLKTREKSIGFAQRERRPQLQHVLLPRTTGFHTCMDALRDSQPVIFDMTIAYPPDQTPSAVSNALESFLKFMKGAGPKEVYIRLKRYQMVRDFFTGCGVVLLTRIVHWIVVKELSQSLSIIKMGEVWRKNG